MSLISDIKQSILAVSDKRLFIVENRDGFIVNHKEALESEYGLNCRIFFGTSLDLRLVRDYEMVRDKESNFIFVPTEDFEILDDVAENCERVTINVQRFLSRYHWNTIKNLSLPELEWLYSQKQFVTLDAITTANKVCEYQRSPDYRKNAINELLKEWERLTAKIDFRKASNWMPALSRIMVSALALESWSKFGDKIQELNEKFQVFLSEQYKAIQYSGVSPLRPKIVSHFASFIARQDDNGKYALIVIDGMNFWQAIILANALEDSSRNLSIKYQASMAWLPSVTELSRQAIFRGDIPAITYSQNPHDEQKLWEYFWKNKHVPNPGIYYQYGGELTPNFNSIRVGYVNTDLDDMMHGAMSYLYLYEDTMRWVKESTIIEDIIKLAENGFKIYLTSDHGNIETMPYKAIAQVDKAGAVSDRRYITISEHAESGRFENSYEGHVHKLFDDDRTYYAIDREIFSTQEGVVTHGGSHFLEVIIPFFTITKHS